MSTKVISFTTFLLLVICWPLHAEKPESIGVPQILNVVLIELDTSPNAKLAKPVVNDWDYWNKCAGKLIARLESELQYRRATEKVKEGHASLFAIRTAARGLDDTKRLTPIVKKLDRICEVTERPSFLLVWIPRQKQVVVVVHDRHEVRAGVALSMLSMFNTIQAAPNLAAGMLSRVGSAYVAPPSVLVSAGLSHLGREDALTLEHLLLAEGLTDTVLHSIRGATAQLIVDSVIQPVSEATPAGATWETIRPRAAGVRDFALDVADSVNLNFGLVDISPGPLAHGWDRWTDKVFSGIYENWGDPGGILLQPQLVVVVDKTGLTSALATKAVAAVKGKTAGGEFTDEGKKYIAVKTPGTAKMFQVPAGKFHLTHTDIALEAKTGDTHRLVRCYDSSTTEASALGSGWSLLPFSLEFDQRVETEDSKNLVALKPVLVDCQVGTRLPYRLMETNSSTSQPAKKNIVARYRKVSSSLQPDLAAHDDGGYLATFAHGFQIAFDDNGRMKWMGNSKDDRVKYVFGSDQLKEIRSAGGKIALLYDEKDCLSGAKSSSGQVVRYVLDSSGRLDSVTGSESGPFKFTYGADGRLATVSAIKGKQKPDLLFTNTYDDKGRMLTHRTSQGQWRFAYDDDIGRVIVTEPASKQTSYYYDAHQRLTACGSLKDQMTLFNYDITGRILQIAKAELLNEPTKNERPKFKISDKVFPLPSAKGKEEG